MQSPTLTRARAVLLVVAIALAALLLRLSSVSSGLPQRTDADSVVFHDQLEWLERGELVAARKVALDYYPLLVPRIASWCLDLAPPAEPARDLAEHLERASAAHRGLRAVVATLSLAAVIATFLVARRFLGDGAALVAAALVATSTLELWFAVQARPHAVSAGLALVAVLAALHLRRSRSLGAWLAAGAAFALALGSLESGVLTAGSFLAALALRERPSERRPAGRALGPSLAAALVVAALPVFYPFAFRPGAAHPSFAFDGEHVELFGHVVYLRAFDGSGFGRIAAALWDYDPWIACLAAAGAALALARLREARALPRRDLAVVAAFALPYLLAFGLYARTYQRFALPLLPFAACLAAYAIVRVAGLARSRALGAALALALLAPQAWLALGFDRARRAPDTVALASHWIAENLDAGSDRLALMPTFDLRLPYDDGSLAAGGVGVENPKHPWFTYQKGLAPPARPRPGWCVRAMPLATDAERAFAARRPLDFVRALDADYAVIEVFGPGRPPDLLAPVRRGLVATGELAARFSPWADPAEDLPLAGQDDELPRRLAWAWRAARAERMGPVIEVWRLRAR